MVGLWRWRPLRLPEGAVLWWHLYLGSLEQLLDREIHRRFIADSSPSTTVSCSGCRRLKGNDHGYGRRSGRTECGKGF